MKRLKKVLLTVLIIIAAILLVAFFLIGRIAKKGLPDYGENISLTGLIEPVTVYRDSLAIPHIYAANEHDLYMVTGYVMAQDRLWQMDLLRRVTLGRLSEIFGDDFIETDLLLRSLSFKSKSDTILANADPGVINALEAFSDGINQYIENARGNFPLEFTILGYKPDRWEPLHSVNLIGYMAWDLKSGWSEMLLEEIASKVDSAHITELLPDLALQKGFTFGQNDESMKTNRLTGLIELEEMGLDIFSGSNNWAVSGNRSITGKPLLANDMHLGFGIPGIWLQMHQVIEGELNVEGLILPGQPLMIVGHNDSIAWGMTNTYVDNLDYYEEKINPEDSNQYLYNGEWRNFDIHEEVIRTKSGQEVTCNYRTNHRGPVVSKARDISDRIITMHWVGFEPSNEMRSVYLANRAKNWNDFKDAFTTFQSISQNIAYADVHGNIGIYCCAGVPIRKRDASMIVLPGWTDEYDWKGMVPFDQLPNEYNPERGYISSANARQASGTYPYYIGTWYDMPYRLDRIRELLDSKEKYAISDFRRMQNDQQSTLSSLFLNTMFRVIEGYNGWDQIEISAIEKLKGWNFDLNTRSPEATISEYWMYCFTTATYGDELDEELFTKFTKVGSINRNAMYNLLTKGSSAWIDNISTEAEETLADIAVQSLKDALDTLQKTMGNDISSWEWGKIHKLTLMHPVGKVKIMDQVFGLNSGTYSVGGSFHTVSPYKYPWFSPKETDHGASHRSIYDLSNWENSISVIPTGICGIPASPYFCDQTELYVSGDYHPDYFAKEKVKENARYEMKFTPKER